MPQSNEGILLLIGALFLLLGLLGGGFEISAIKIPPVGKYTRLFAFVIGSIVFGLGVLRLIFPAPQPIPVAIVPTAPPTVTPTEIPPSPIPPTETVPPAPTHTLAPPTRQEPTSTVAPDATTLPRSAIIQDVTVDYDVTRFQKKGMLIHVKFSVSGMQNQEGRATAYFAQRDDTPLQDQNGEYNTTDGQVSVGESFTPGYPVTIYDNLELFMPYDELELGPGSYELKFHVQLWERAHPENPALAISPDIPFDFSK